MSYITAIGTANPINRFRQSIIADFMVRAMNLGQGDTRKLKTIFRSSGIEYRHSVLEDYGRTDGFTFYPDTPNLGPFPGTEKRMQIFRQNALALSVCSVNDMVQYFPFVSTGEITHIIVVSCTGMYAPGLEIDLINTLKLSRRVHRTAINFMGCHASFNALKVADALCRSDEGSKVLIVCTELCSLHFQREASDDNLLANALFADGSASLLVEAHTNSPMKLKLEAFHSDLVLDGFSDMAWNIGDIGFEMKLSSYVPDLIKTGIRSLANSLLEKGSLNLSDIRYFAVHPGGWKILQVVEEALDLDRSKNAAAYHVLKNYGNMSSPTVLFVLKEIVKNLTEGDTGERILTFAFGPGLTLESMVLKIENIRSHA